MKKTSKMVLTLTAIGVAAAITTPQFDMGTQTGNTNPVLIPAAEAAVGRTFGSSSSSRGSSSSRSFNRGSSSSSSFNRGSSSSSSSLPNNIKTTQDKIYGASDSKTSTSGKTDWKNPNANSSVDHVYGNRGNGSLDLTPPDNYYKPGTGRDDDDEKPATSEKPTTTPTETPVEPEVSKGGTIIETTDMPALDGDLKRFKFNKGGAELLVPES